MNINLLIREMNVIGVISGGFKMDKIVINGGNRLTVKLKLKVQKCCITSINSFFISFRGAK